MIPDVGRDVARTKLIGGGREIAAEMAAEEAEQEIDRAVDDEHPRHQEVPIAGECQVRAERRPLRERAGLRPAIEVVGHAEDAGGVDGVVADARGADGLLRLGIVAAGDRQHGRHAGIAVMAPIKLRMHVEHRKPAHQQEREAEQVDPVREAHHERMAIDDFAARRGCGGFRGDGCALLAQGHCASLSGSGSEVTPGHSTANTTSLPNCALTASFRAS